jgi:hypothetical protein
VVKGNKQKICYCLIEIPLKENRATLPLRFTNLLGHSKLKHKEAKVEANSKVKHEKKCGVTF